MEKRAYDQIFFFFFFFCEFTFIHSWNMETHFDFSGQKKNYTKAVKRSLSAGNSFYFRNMYLRFKL